MFKLIPSEANKRRPCYCVNATNQIQVNRITNIPNWQLEKLLIKKNA